MYAGCVVSVILEWQADTTRTSSATDNCPVLPDRQPPSFPPRQTTAQFFTTDNRPVLPDRQPPCFRPLLSVRPCSVQTLIPHRPIQPQFDGHRFECPVSQVHELQITSRGMSTDGPWSVKSSLKPNPSNIPTTPTKPWLPQVRPSFHSQTDNGSRPKRQDPIQADRWFPLNYLGLRQVCRHHE